MFLPRSKYQIKQASWGQFELSGSNKSYVGPYIEDYLGRTYAGTDLEGAENRVLIPVQNDSVMPQVARRVEILPTERNYQEGSFIRYFRQNVTTKVAEEIDEGTYRDSKNVKTWITATCTWLIRGKLDDQLIYNHTWRGLRWQNQQTLNKLNRKIYHLSELLDLHPEDFVEEN